MADQVFSEEYFTLLNLLSNIIVVCVTQLCLVVEQAVVYHLKALGDDVLSIFVYFNDSVVLNNIYLFLIDPAVDVPIMEQEDYELLIKLNHFFPWGASDNNVK